MGDFLGAPHDAGMGLDTDTAWLKASRQCQSVSPKLVCKATQKGAMNTGGGTKTNCF